MRILHALFQDARLLTEMPIPDLAGHILYHLVDTRSIHGAAQQRTNFCRGIVKAYAERGSSNSLEAGVACSMAWTWLETNGLITFHPEQDGWHIVTPLGEQLAATGGFGSFVESAQLPEAFLHPALLVHARPLFFQGRYDTAVFEAFKTLEIAVRTAAGLGNDMLGVNLASRAFNPEDGPLTSKQAEKGERVALMSLMTGAIGSYKNPASHRAVNLTAEEAREMLVLASHLLKIVDARSQLSQ